jgi:hypothetical protein
MGAFAWTTSLLNKVNYFPHYFPHQMAIKLAEKGFLEKPEKLNKTCPLLPRDAQRVGSLKPNGRESVLHGPPMCKRQQSRSSRHGYDAVDGAFMTLPPYPRSREGEGHDTSSLPKFAPFDRLVDRIEAKRASMRVNQLTNCRWRKPDAQRFTSTRSAAWRLLGGKCSHLLTCEGKNRHFPGH